MATLDKAYQNDINLTDEEERAMHFVRLGTHSFHGRWNWVPEAMLEDIAEYNYHGKTKEQLIERLFDHKAEIEYMISELSRMEGEPPRLDFFHVMTALRSEE